MTPELLAYLLDNDYIQEEDFPDLLDDGVIDEGVLGLAGRVIKAPFRIAGRVIKAPFRIAGRVIKAPFRIAGRAAKWAIGEDLIQEIPAIGKYNWQGFLRTRKHQRLQGILRKRMLARESISPGKKVLAGVIGGGLIGAGYGIVKQLRAKARREKEARQVDVLRKAFKIESIRSGAVGGFTAGPLAFTTAQKKRMKIFRNRSGEKYGMKEREDTLGERSPGTYAGFLLKKRFGGNLRKLADYHKHLRRQNVLGAIFR